MTTCNKSAALSGYSNANTYADVAMCECPYSTSTMCLLPQPMVKNFAPTLE